LEHVNLNQWFKDNPIIDADNHQFLNQEVQAFTAELTASVSEHVAHDELHRTGEAWLGPEPYYRLYHSILDDKLRESCFTN
jgi:hypothetical protein